MEDLPSYHKKQKNQVRLFITFVETADSPGDSEISFLMFLINIFIRRFAPERIYWSILENLGCNSWTIPAEPCRAVQPRRPPNPRGSKMCLPDIADGSLLDDRGSAPANHIHDTDGR